MRSTHPFEQEEVMAYLDGEIPADRAAEIALHMQKCAECQTLAASFRNLSHELAAWGIEASPARLTEQLNRQAAAATQQAQRKPSLEELTPLQRLLALARSKRTRHWAWASAGALAMLAVMLIGWPALHRDRGVNSYVAHNSAGRGIVGGTAAESQANESRAQVGFEDARIASSLEMNSSLNGRNVAAPARSAARGVGVASPAPPPPPGAPSAPMIARTASLSIIAKDFASVESAVKSVTARHSGYIGELNTAAPTDAAKTFSATLRIPSAQLDAALAELKQLGRVEQETQGGEEVTKQYTDLVARLKISRATEQRLLDVLRNNTGKVKDVLEVENEISRVRGEIEEMEADQRTLQSRVDFGTVTLSVAEEYKASLHSAPFSTGARLHNAFVTGYHSVVENVIGLLAWLLESGPTLLLWAALLFFPARWIWRRIRRALTTVPKPAAA
jgi:anti-sigma factor RsiW